MSILGICTVTCKKETTYFYQLSKYTQISLALLNLTQVMEIYLKKGCPMNNSHILVLLVTTLHCQSLYNFIFLENMEKNVENDNYEKELITIFNLTDGSSIFCELLS